MQNIQASGNSENILVVKKIWQRKEQKLQSVNEKK